MKAIHIKMMENGDIELDVEGEMTYVEVIGVLEICKSIVTDKAQTR